MTIKISLPGIAFIFALMLVSTMALASAMIVSDVEGGKVFPGESTKVQLTVDNTLTDDVQDVSVVLNLEGTGFTSVGSSEDSIDEIREGKDESFSYTIKAPSTLRPGEYNIPYTIIYTFQDSSNRKNGSFGITVGAKTELSYSIETNNNVIGEQGELSLKVVNKGLGDIRFVSVRLLPSSSYTLLSDENIYIGTISSDDFETASYKVKFNNENAVLDAVITYKDFDNVQRTEKVTLPLTVYSREKALELGIVKKSNAPIYASTIIILIVLWFVWRIYKKRQREKKRAANNSKEKSGK